MRMFIGMIFGCLLTMAAVYIHDSVVTSPAAAGTETSNMIVNWDVAERRWGDIKETAHTAWLRLQNIDTRS